MKEPSLFLFSRRKGAAGPLSPKKVLLLGFPNVGKSLLFHHLTGAYAVVSNYPGTTVEVTRGKGIIEGREVEVIDTPGIYTLKGKSEDEKVALKVLAEEKPRLLLFITEAVSFPRALPMLLELKSYDIPLILVLNMADEAEKKGVFLDEVALEKELQLPVVATVCTEKIGLGKLKKAMKALLFPSFPAVRTIAGYKKAPVSVRPRIASRKLPGYSAPNPFDHRSRSQRLHLLLLNPFIGYPIAFLLLFLCFYFILGVIGAGIIAGYLEEKVFRGYIAPPLQFYVEKYVTPSYLKEIIIGDYGLVAMGLRYSLVIVLPVVSIFFLFFALLEDSGYLPRLSYLLHRPLGYLGLDGRGAVPLVTGFGCGTMGVLVTRILESRRERFLATFLLSLGIPCSAQMGLLIALLSPYPLLLLFWGFSWGVLFSGAGLLLNRMLPGKRRCSCIEFPPLRVPGFFAVLRKTLARIIWYVREIVPFFLLISVIFQWLVIKDLIAPLEAFFYPLFLNLGLPRETIAVFLFGFLRRDYAAAGLYDLMQQGSLSPASAIVSTIVLTLFFPCIAQLTVIVKERGIGESLLILLLIALTSYGAGYGMHLLVS